MNKVRTKIETAYKINSEEVDKNEFKATLIKKWRSGTLEARFVSKAKQEEVKEYGYAYINVYSEFVI